MLLSTFPSNSIAILCFSFHVGREKSMCEVVSSSQERIHFFMLDTPYIGVDGIVVRILSLRDI